MYKVMDYYEYSECLGEYETREEAEEIMQARIDETAGECRVRIYKE